MVEVVSRLFGTEAKARKHLPVQSTAAYHRGNVARLRRTATPVVAKIKNHVLHTRSAKAVERQTQRGLAGGDEFFIHQIAHFVAIGCGKHLRRDDRTELEGHRNHGEAALHTCFIRDNKTARHALGSGCTGLAVDDLRWRETVNADDGVAPREQFAQAQRAQRLNQPHFEDRLRCVGPTQCIAVARARAFDKKLIGCDDALCKTVAVNRLVQERVQVLVHGCGSGVGHALFVVPKILIVHVIAQPRALAVNAATCRGVGVAAAHHGHGRYRTAAATATTATTATTRCQKARREQTQCGRFEKMKLTLCCHNTPFN